jgi:hypothetical protein
MEKWQVRGSAEYDDVRVAWRLLQSKLSERELKEATALEGKGQPATRPTVR